MEGDPICAGNLAGCHQLTLQIVGNGDGHCERGGIVGDTVGIAGGGLLADHIVVGTFLGEGKRREVELSVEEVSRRQHGAALQRITVGIGLGQQEGKFLVQQVSAHQNLGAADDVGGILRLVGVDEGHSVVHGVDDLIGSGQLAVYIGHIHHDAVHGGICGDAVSVGGGFGQGEVEHADRVKHQILIEDDVAVCVVAAGANHVVVDAPQLEGELSCLHSASVQDLLGEVQLDGGIGGVIGVGKGGGIVVLCAVDADDFGGGGAVAVVGDINHHGIALGGVVHTGHDRGGNDLL